MNPTEIVKLIWPIVLIQLAVQIYAIVDLLKRGKTRNLNMAVWLVIIIIGEVVGPIVYFLVGRSEE